MHDGTDGSYGGKGVGYICANQRCVVSPQSVYSEGVGRTDFVGTRLVRDNGVG